MFKKQLPEMIKVNKNLIKFEKDKQLFNMSIFSLKLINLEMFEAYIKTKLSNSFFKSFKSSANG